jgi:hypothetical protein
MYMTGTGRTTTYTNARSCKKGREGDGLHVAWRQAFYAGSSSGPTHGGIAYLQDKAEDWRSKIHSLAPTAPSLPLETSVFRTMSTSSLRKFVTTTSRSLSMSGRTWDRAALSLKPMVTNTAICMGGTTDAATMSGYGQMAGWTVSVSTTCFDVLLHADSNSPDSLSSRWKEARLWKRVLLESLGA